MVDEVPHNRFIFALVLSAFVLWKSITCFIKTDASCKVDELVVERKENMWKEVYDIKFGIHCINHVDIAAARYTGFYNVPNETVTRIVAYYDPKKDGIYACSIKPYLGIINKLKGVPRISNAYEGLGVGGSITSGMAIMIILFCYIMLVADAQKREKKKGYAKPLVVIDTEAPK